MHSALVLSVLWLSSIRECWASNGTTQAVVVPPSEYFEGNDGPWSSFDLRVGTPPQDVRVLVSTASPESLVVLSEYGCAQAVFTTGSVPSNCAVSRGVLYNQNESSTWHDMGTYGINQNGVGLEANLGYTERVDFGLETLGVGLTGSTLQNQTVGGIVSTSPFYMGIFGLNNQPLNFTAVGNYSSPAFITTLKDQGLIPSISWSYTAGAKYRLKQVYGQLIFGGYDTSRFQANSATFTMAGDITRDLVVALQSISYSGTTSSTLLSDPINIFIDSTDPNFWLPDSVCDAFEKAFGLTLDTASGLYLVNDTQHNALLAQDAQVTFRLSDVSSGGEAVTIVLPYNAFDLTAQYPLVNTTSSYFPLKRAANATQYTLGRAFLQEAYLTADYERGVFNVSACAWSEGATQNLVTITPKGSATNTTSGGSDSGGSSSASASVGGGAIAGIVIGVVAFVAILAALIAFFIRRRRKAARYSATEPKPDAAVMAGPVFNDSHYSPFSQEPTLPSQEHSTGTSDSLARAKNGEASPEEHHGNELEAQPTTELDGNEIQPPQAPVYYELAGSSVGGRSNQDVSMVGTLPSRDERTSGEGSPMVSTLGTTWHDGGRDISDLVSPATPTHHNGFSPRTYHHSSESS